MWINFLHAYLAGEYDPREESTVTETWTQARCVEEIAEPYPSVRVTPHTGPNRDRSVVACPDGRSVVVGPDGEIVADSRRGTAADVALARGHALEEVDLLASGTQVEHDGRTLDPRRVVVRRMRRPGYDPARDALLVEDADGTWTYVPPSCSLQMSVDYMTWSSAKRVAGVVADIVWELRAGSHELVPSDYGAER